MVKIDVKQQWQPALALVIAAAVIVVVQPDSRANRVSTLDLEETGFDELYIQFVDADRTRAAIVDRGATTIRRGEASEQAPEWSIESLSGDGWLARSEDEGVVFFVPVSDVSDWVYPFLYSFVRERRRGLELPAAEWTTLYVDRLYQGLFLRVKLPFDRAETASRRELLAVEAGRVAQVDTWFEPSSGGPGLPDDLEVEARHGSLAWLSAVRSETETLLMLSRRPQELGLMPLPVSVPSLFAATHGVEPTYVEEEQAPSWNESWRASVADTTYLAEVELEALGADFEEYRDVFLAALRIHGEFHGNTSDLQASIPRRQRAGVDLDLTLEGN